MAHTYFPSGLVVKSPKVDTQRVGTYAVGWDVDVKQFGKNEYLWMVVSGFHTPHIQFGSTSYTMGYMVEGVCPKRCVVVTYNHTAGPVTYRNHVLEAGELLLLTHDEAMDLIVGGRCVTFTIAIEEAFFEASFEAYFGKKFIKSKHRKFRFNPESELTYREFVVGWLDYFTVHNAAEKYAIDYETLETQIMHKLFSFLRLDTSASLCEHRVLKRARELLHHSLEKDFKITDAAEILGVSQRTLEYLFKRHFGVTPKAYVQLLRLHKIHETLKTADPLTTKVSDVALRYAFFHMGHFATEYKKLFGETPTETLKK